MLAKTLYLIRHGKAEEHSFLKRDYERDLVSKGIERGKIVANKIKAQLQASNLLVISSSANRALQTAEVFCEQLGFPQNDIQQTKKIYEAHYLDILEVINQVGNEIDTLLVFGHNPGLSYLTDYLCNVNTDLKTAHCAKIILPERFHFSDVSGGTCHLETVISE